MQKQKESEENNKRLVELEQEIQDMNCVILDSSDNKKYKRDETLLKIFDFVDDNEFDDDDDFSDNESNEGK